MLISNEMNAAINEQIGNELAASHQYVAIATYFDGEGLPALAKHFYKQAHEEREHAMRLVKYLVDADAEVEIPGVPAPKPRFSSAEDAVRLSYDSEMRVTAQITQLMDRAVKESDYMSRNMLEWFIAEQREEVSSMDALLRTVERAADANVLLVEEQLARTAGAEDETAGAAPPAAGGAL